MKSDPHSVDGRATDAEIIAASWSDPEQFGGIFERHFGAIHRYVARRLGESLADDLAAEVFTVAFERRRTFRLETADARPWLYGIATNLIRNNRRAEQRLLAAVARLGHEAQLIASPNGSTADATRPGLADALALLGQDQRDVLLLHAWAELSHAEIAASLGIPEGTVASRLARARQCLRSSSGGEDRDWIVTDVCLKKEP